MISSNGSTRHGEPLEGVLDEVRQVCADARQRLSETSSAAETLADIEQMIKEPLRVAVVGRPACGRSTLDAARQRNQPKTEGGTCTVLTPHPAALQEIVLVCHAADRATAMWLIEVLERAGHEVVPTQPAGVVRLVAQRPPDSNRVILLLVTRRLHGDLHEHLPAIISIGAAVLPVVLDDPQYFGWGRLDELLYLDLRGVERDPAAAIVLHALDRLRRGGAVKAVPAGDFVFISYAFDDDATATVVERHLAGDGYATFRAADFMFGADWVSMMDEAVRAAWLVIALISPAYLRSFWCYEELTATAAERRMLVQIEHADKLDSIRDQWIPVRADLTGLGEPAFRDRLLALVRNERTLSARERSIRAARERPPEANDEQHR